MSEKEDVREWVERSPYTEGLGLKLDRLDAETARLVLPFREGNTNPGNVLHGGVAASLAAVGAQTVAHAVLGPESAPFQLAQIQVSYLAAAKEEAVVAEARLLRRGKVLCFVEVEVATEAGKPIAHATATVRGRFGAEPAALARVAGDDGAADPGPLGPHIAKTPFMGRLGIDVEHMAGSRSRIRLPDRAAHRDLAGGVHEGALLALLDTTGAMAAWATTGPGRFKASTPSLQAQVLAPPPAGELVAYGRLLQRDAETFWTDVEVAGPEGGCVARGCVLYRIVP
jgi:uncharacterized protein (TIGR00369 family)